MERIWLSQLPSTDPAFAPLQRAEHLSDPEDWQVLAFWHRQAVAEAAWGASLDVMEDRARDKRDRAAELREQDKQQGGTNAVAVHTAELEALGYALGLTAARAAIRTHELAQTGTGVAA
jgi:hypothetical protein